MFGSLLDYWAIEQSKNLNSVDIPCDETSSFSHNPTVLTCGLGVVSSTR